MIPLSSTPTPQYRIKCRFNGKGPAKVVDYAFTEKQAEDIVFDWIVEIGERDVWAERIPPTKIKKSVKKRM